MARDWTKGRDGRSNSSARYEQAVLVVASIVANHRLGDDVEATARLIVSHLAHGLGLTVADEPRRGR